MWSGESAISDLGGERGGEGRQDEPDITLVSWGFSSNRDNGGYHCVIKSMREKALCVPIRAQL